jgi:hypothetical protein
MGAMELFVSIIVDVLLIWLHLPIFTRFVSEQVLQMIVIFEVKLWEWKKTNLRGFVEPLGRDGMNGTALLTSLCRNNAIRWQHGNTVGVA